MDCGTYFVLGKNDTDPQHWLMGYMNDWRGAVYRETGGYISGGD